MPKRFVCLIHHKTYTKRCPQCESEAAAAPKVSQRSDVVHHRLVREWRVTRIVEEKTAVEATTREEAMKIAENPYSVRIIRETCVERTRNTP